MRVGPFVLATVLTAGLYTGAGLLRTGYQPGPTRHSFMAEQQIRRALAQRTHICVLSVPLRDALQQLSDRHAVRFLIQDDVLRTHDLTIDEPVNCVAFGVRLDSALEVLLKDVNLTYFVRDNAIVVTSERAYRFDPVNVVPRVYTLPAPGAGSRALGEEEIARVIQRTLGADQRSGSGGAGEIMVLPGSLVVSHLPHVHEQIEYMLAQLDRWYLQPEPSSTIFLSRSDALLSGHQVLERLSQPAHIEFHRATLTDACRFLSREYEIPLVVDPSVLRDTGDGASASVTVNLRGLPLGEALDQMFDHAGW